MYCVKNIEQFLNDGQGSVLDVDVKAGILARANDVASNNDGMIMGGSTREIIIDEKVVRMFEDDLGSDMNQLAILMDLAGSVAKEERGKLHPSHVVRSSDASSFDFVCIKCNATDDPHAGSWGRLVEPCPG